MPRKSRNVLRAVSRAVRSIVAPASLFEDSTTAPAALVEPSADMFGEDELPPVEDIAAAASAFAKAADQARAADRGKRAARKLLDRLPAGLYGAWKVERVPSGRQTADLDEIRRIFKAHGLGPVPMKASAPSLKVSRVTPAAALAVDEFVSLATAVRVPAVA
jgi:hypothetical protein